jgi:hypothetical protein
MSTLFRKRMPPEKRLCQSLKEYVVLLQSTGNLPPKEELRVVHIANEQRSTGNKGRDAAYVASLKRIGMLPGMADYIVFYKGGTVRFIEMKASKSSPQSAAQKQFEQDFTGMGFPYLLTWDIDEAVAFIRKGISS